jgi:hypothetical protein
MRTMDIPSFPEDAAKELEDIGGLIKGRLTGNVVLYPKQSLRLISYMAWPNDETARAGWMRVHISSKIRNDDQADPATLESSSSEIRNDDQGDPAKLEIADLNSHWATTAASPSIFLSKLKLIQQHWARTADILHHHYDLAQGEHQKGRGGPSVGKAIHLIATNAKTKGTGKSILWQIWRDYKDVSHLVTAANLVAAEAQHRSRTEQWRIVPRLQPVQVTHLLPDLVLAVGLTFEKYGLDAPVHGSEGPLLDPVNLWRIPTDIRLAPISPPDRKMRTQDILILSARRAGHRGRQKDRAKATPVLD